MTQHPAMTCREFVDFVMDYLSHELPEGTRQTFEWHLGACPNCVRYLETYKTTVLLARAAFMVPDDEPPTEVPEELIQAILNAQKSAR